MMNVRKLSQLYSQKLIVDPPAIQYNEYSALMSRLETNHKALLATKQNDGKVSVEFWTKELDYATAERTILQKEGLPQTKLDLVDKKIRELKNLITKGTSQEPEPSSYSSLSAILLGKARI